MSNAVPETTEKARRHREILAVLAERSIASQDDLARALKGRGFPVTQGTLSRDLRDLRVVRLPQEGGYRYAPSLKLADAHGVEPEGKRLRDVATLEVTGIAANETAVVVRTLTGRAQGVAVWLDSLKDPDILGTVAGDDTILVLPRTTKKTARLLSRLAMTLGLD